MKGALALITPLLLLLGACAAPPILPPHEEAFIRHDRLGHHLHAEGALAEARRSFQQALREAELMDDRRKAASTLINLGSIALESAATEDAAAAFARAFTLARSEGFVQLELTARLGSARLLALGGETAAAERAYRELVEESATPAQRIGALNGHALALAELNRIDEALERLATALELAERAGAAAPLAATLINRAALRLRRGEAEAAAGDARRALAIDRAINRPRSIAADLILLGHIHDRLGETERAADHYRQADAIHRHLGDAEGLKRIEALEHQSPAK